MIINYFGICLSEEDVIWAKENLENVTVILDNVQAPFEMAKETKSDFVFTSLRKAFPVPDGGVVVKTKENITSVTIENKFSQYKIAASFLKNLRSRGYYDEDLYLYLYGKGEDIMDRDYESGPAIQ